MRLTYYMKKLLNGRYEKVEKIDEGTYGTVYKAIDRCAGTEKGVKMSIDLPLNTTKLPADPTVRKKVEALMSSIRSGPIQKGTEKGGEGCVSLKKCRLYKVSLRFNYIGCRQ
eukprot:TRINITY_DN10814_c0_g1_i13.p2 TRINITY_DN10814_c0_g1~~TRINITY_DN10814_c0_g1_i13.p2  ORF type:complete len:112 (-),score=19.26 TRINITY_DN10814_c0_g1_i13:1607-1942(-)